MIDREKIRTIKKKQNEQKLKEENTQLLNRVNMMEEMFINLAYQNAKNKIKQINIKGVIFMLSKIIINQIKYGRMNKEDLLKKSNVFFLVGQLTEEEYMEIVGLLTPSKPKEEKKPLESKPIEEKTKEDTKTIVK